MSLITPVILAGGIGSRLWPLSRQAMPKQFLSLLDEKSLLQNTLARVNGDCFNDTILVCNEQHRFIASHQCEAIGVTPKAILLEQQGKNTAPAIALAAQYALAQGIDSPIFVIPADHYIANFEHLVQQLPDAIAMAEQGKLVTFSIKPDTANCGYGYIKQGSKIANSHCYQVDEFKEKPDLELAQQYVTSGEYSFNSGMFLFTPKSYLRELERFAPKIARAVADAASFSQDLGFIRADEAALEHCPSDSIDYAILERSDNVVVLPLALNWSDVGSFNALWQSASKDSLGNHASYNDVLFNSENNLVYSEEGHTIAALGVNNLAVIHTHDATLVANKAQLDQLPQLLAQLANKQSDKLLNHQAVYRPWGSYRVLVEGSGFKVKKITVNSGGRLSTQRHQHRAEHWVVVSGFADVSIDDKASVLKADQSCYIAAGQIHSLANSQAEPLIVIEVQTGSILDESDIERFDDQYGRN
ncbi:MULTISPECIES: mannose-1-phosphate guanylyltransferase/mannose-6-phosphate isomerase [unclassified Pseudoalteromonas]|uniref:mannose-1-phosphate guanylyltransferase/mannose-6-phosphate isomerase n=1 Tax=unclassified Pseudoalteromonas TaxID=194690 RepID=UPI0025B5DC49|nr:MULTISPECIES: mannose-1-phosphate guanylyltransferase/mannose-6-phosphate isomerase [unclassified Pseudoalteromonas]MDN3378471.1 mannose-1-phosphate guanylyltransferase/mannose-6-phosphate isomerase [Pseudoalteromonas sp. APC 3893]MDN3387116.1 mannose-1-phosphate guanylyltransferase/mannose-6-phosphate isomerase [Pseudoalteromonas sp. APC 4017]